MRYLILILICQFFALAAMAQSVEVRKYYLEDGHDSYKRMRHKFYFKSLENNGSVKHVKTEEYMQKYFVDAYKCDDGDNVSWLSNLLFCPVTNESEAEVVISGNYIFTSGATVLEKRRTEKSGTVRLPYFEDMTKNAAELNIILKFEYKDGTPLVTDTIAILKASEKVSLGELEEAIDEQVKYKIAYYLYAKDGENQYINLPKVKIKDKALKEEFATVKELLKDKEFEKAGAICKKVHGVVNSPESAQMLGICYELVGNYPKANELYKAKPDFHIKARMKKSMQLLDYAQSIGYEPEFIDFDI